MSLPLTLGLQNSDELNFGVADFWSYFFPFDDVAREFGDHLDLILEAGPCPGGLPSTIVDVTSSPPRLVRAGAIPLTELAEIMPELKRIPARGAPGE
ncbi:MAG: Sua5/YciO/YrdC/YwlC family protein [Deltaproteobacteria bacterium]|nr:Sua5/YciO/YrdC/YwlC family protein [Deltaproteobacteria bacterium]